MKKSFEIEELRRFRRLDVLSKIGWLLSFRFLHPKRWLDREPKSYDDEPPLVSLARLAEEGIQEETHRLSKDNLDRVNELFASVIKKDGIISDKELELVRKFILEQGYEEVSEQEIEEYLSRIGVYTDNPLKLKNTLHLLKKNSKDSQTKKIVATLYRLAHLHGEDSLQSRKVADYANQLGLSLSDIRHLNTNIKTETEEAENGNIKG
jgi:hypothetical protein